MGVNLCSFQFNDAHIIKYRYCTVVKLDKIDELFVATKTNTTIRKAYRLL